MLWLHKNTCLYDKAQNKAPKHYKMQWPMISLNSDVLQSIQGHNYSNGLSRPFASCFLPDDLGILTK